DGVDLANSIETGIRPGVQNRAVDHAKDGNGCANPERQRQDCGKGKAWSSRHLPNGIAQVLQELLHSRLAQEGWQAMGCQKQSWNQCREPIRCSFYWESV